jgi:nicotinate-nucleotide adenylyltransferase
MTIKKSKKTGLFFGSFNPIHIGHLIIANHMVSDTDLDEVWLVVSPHNPLKEKSSLANDYDRLHMVEIALEDSINLKASNVEFSLPKPSYTIDTLTYLEEKYPNKSFSIIMGGDSLVSLPKWKNYEKILENHTIYVYNRPESDTTKLPFNKKTLTFVDAPLIDLSATYIRGRISNSLSVKYILPDKVFEFIDSKRLYSF